MSNLSLSNFAANEAAAAVESMEPHAEEIVKSIQGHSMDDSSRMIRFINSVPVSERNYSVFLFKQVIRVELLSAIQDIEIDLKNVKLECLKLVVPNIYKYQGVDETPEEKKKFLEKFYSGSDNDDDDDNDDKSLVRKKLKNFFQVCQNERHMYVRDLEDPPKGFSKSLNWKSFINDEQVYEKMPGINVPMYYIGSRNSFTSLHVEDGKLGSLNLLRGGSPKLWIVIDRRFDEKLEKDIWKILFEKKKIGCKLVLQHKVYFPTPTMLKKLNIPFTVFLQRHGDLVYLRPRVYHAVVNLGANVAEAVNFASSEWIAQKNTSNCGCDENLSKDVLPDDCLHPFTKVGKRKDVACRFCQSLFGTKKTMSEHCQLRHQDQLKSDEKKRISCNVCQENFSTRGALHKHKQRKHETVNRQQCTECRKFVRNLSEHKKKVHTENINCLHCKRSLKRNSLSKHLRTCKPGEPECPTCGKKCTSFGYLKQHEKIHT